MIKSPGDSVRSSLRSPTSSIARSSLFRVSFQAGGSQRGSAGTAANFAPLPLLPEHGAARRVAPTSSEDMMQMQHINGMRTEAISKFEQEIWRLLNVAGSELAESYMKVTQLDEQNFDVLRRTNVCLREEIGRLRHAATHSEHKPQTPTEDVSILQVEDSPRRRDKVSILGSGSWNLSRDFQRKSLQSPTSGSPTRRVSPTPTSIIPEATEAANDSQPRQSEPTNRFAVRMEAIRRATRDLNDVDICSEDEMDEEDTLQIGLSEPDVGQLKKITSAESISINHNNDSDEKPDVSASGKVKMMRFADSVRSAGSELLTANNYELLSTWTDDVELRGVSRRKFQSNGIEDDEYEDGDEERKPLPGEALLQKLVILPTSVLILIWSALGYMLIFYDSIALPLQFSDINMDYTVFVIIGWVIRLYWTLHIPISMFTAQEQMSGRIQTQVTKVLQAYVKGRFAFDLLLAVFDWLAVFMDSEKMGLLKWLRITRLARLVQARTMPTIFKKMLGESDSGHGATFLAIIKDVFLLCWSTHLGACLWYGIGISGQPNDNWIALARESGFDVGTWEFIYVHAFRWQLTNFVGESGLNPQTIPEYCFLIFTSICGFVATCICVSSMTSAMTRLDIAVAQDARNFTILKQFLKEHKISSKLATRVVQNAQFQVNWQKKRTPEDQIALLALVSQPLQIELHFEINMKVLGSHPLFFVYSILNEQAMRQVCHTAISRHHIAKGDILFHAEELASAEMYFVNDGKIVYTHHSGNSETLTDRQWFCEPVLWTSWIHHGTARAKTEVTLSLLSMQSLQDVARSDVNGNQFFILNYAEYFIEHLNETSPVKLTDLDSEDVDTAWLVQKSLPENISKQKRKHIISQIMTHQQSEEHGTMFKLVPFFRPHESLHGLSTRFSNSSGGRGSSRFSTGSGEHKGLLRDNAGDKIVLPTDIVQSDGPSRRTRMAGVAFLGQKGDRATWSSNERCSENSVIELPRSSDFGSCVGSIEVAPYKSNSLGRDESEALAVTSFRDSSGSRGGEQAWTFMGSMESITEHG